MNKYRRKEIYQLIQRITNDSTDLKRILTEEQNYFESMPENLQSSSRGENSEYYIECLEDTVELLEEAIEKLQEI